MDIFIFNLTFAAKCFEWLEEFFKVCIAQYRRTKKYYTFKCVNKRRCVQHMITDSILHELNLLAHLSHPFIVNLWFAFQVILYFSNLKFKNCILTCIFLLSKLSIMV